MIPPIQSLFWRASNHSAEVDQRSRPVATNAVSPSNRSVGINSASNACTSMSGSHSANQNGINIQHRDERIQLMIDQG